MAAALGLDDPVLHESDADIIARVLAGSQTGLDFAQLVERGTVWVPPEGAVVQFADLRFPTPSGRVELASEAAEGDGHGLLPRPHADERPAPGRLRLLSPASPWALNTSFSNDPKVIRRGGPLTLGLGAEDAAALGLSDGDLARVSSDAGSLVVPVHITDTLPAGVAFMPKGRWPKLERDGANVNALTLARPSDMGASTTVHGLEVSVTQSDSPRLRECPGPTAHRVRTARRLRGCPPGTGRTNHSRRRRSAPEALIWRVVCDDAVGQRQRLVLDEQATTLDRDTWAAA